jgi:RNA polymerase sigma-70 factor (ECF subfamily)
METPELQPHQASKPDEWLDAHGDYLYACALQKVGNSHVAEDLVQETFLAGLKSGSAFAGKASERSWFLGILRNKVADYFRKKYRDKSYSEQHDEGYERITGPFDTNGHWDNNKGFAPQDWPPTPSHVLEQKEFWDVFHSCLGTLPERMAEVFLQHEVKDSTAEEIMRDLDVSSSNLWVLLYRARMRLRTCLEQNWFGKK